MELRLEPGSTLYATLPLGERDGTFFKHTVHWEKLVSDALQGGKLPFGKEQITPVGLIYINLILKKKKIIILYWSIAK